VKLPVWDLLTASSGAFPVVLLTVIVAAIEVRLPEGSRFVTTITIEPGDAIREAGIVATICVGLTEVIAKAVPFASGTALMNPDPAMMMV
jgi:hypothetical protein